MHKVTSDYFMRRNTVFTQRGRSQAEEHYKGDLLATPCGVRALLFSQVIRMVVEQDVSAGLV